MTRSPLRRDGEGIAVVLWDGWPRPLTITVGTAELRLFGTPQIRALHYMLGELLAADPHPDDRPAREP